MRDNQTEGVGGYVKERDKEGKGQRGDREERM